MSSNGHQSGTQDREPLRADEWLEARHADRSQRSLFARGRGLLPAAIEDLAGDSGGGGEPAALMAGRFAHPALAFFNDPGNGNLSEGRARLWFRLAPAQAEEKGRPAAEVLARFDTGDPFLVERPWGKGDNPKTAVAAFLEGNTDFEVDRAIESKLLITVAPGGYLRRRG